MVHERMDAHLVLDGAEESGLLFSGFATIVQNSENLFGSDRRRWRGAKKHRKNRLSSASCPDFESPRMSDQVYSP